RLSVTRRARWWTRGLPPMAVATSHLAVRDLGFDLAPPETTAEHPRDVLPFDADFAAIDAAVSPEMLPCTRLVLSFAGYPNRSASFATRHARQSRPRVTPPRSGRSPRGRRLGHRPICSRHLPRCPEHRQQPAVEADVSRGLPSENEQEAHQEEHRVRAGAAGEHEVEVHERASHGGDAGEGAEDQAEADRRLPEGDDPAHEALRVAVDEELDEAAVPVVGDGRLGRRWRHRRDALPERQDARAVVDVVRRGAGVDHLVPAGLQPGPPDVDAKEKPDECHARVGEEESCEGRVLDDGAPGREGSTHVVPPLCTYVRVHRDTRPQENERYLAVWIGLPAADSAASRNVSESVG